MERLGKNHGKYHGETINISAVLQNIESAATDHSWRTECFHEVQNLRLLALRLPPAGPAPNSPAPRIYLSAGIHGDEPAGPLAALRLLREHQWPGGAEIVLLPCLNPIGFQLNQRGDAQGIDLNRDYLLTRTPEIKSHIAWLKRESPFDLCLCLHEDWEASGFYLYELNPDRQPSLAAAMLRETSRYCPIDRSEEIEGRLARDGIINPNLDPAMRPEWPEAFWLIQHKTRLSYTLEAPSDFPLHVRVDALCAAVRVALKQFVAPASQ